MQLCHDTKVSIDNVKKAVEFWRAHGFEIDEVLTTRRVCDDDIEDTGPKRRHIMITNQRSLDAEETPGMMVPWYYNSDRKRFSSVLILVSDDHADNMTIIKHEIGHALGLNHSPDENNLMNAYIKLP